MATALEIAQQVVDELGLPPIVSLSGTGGTTGTTTRQIMALLNRSGDELYQAHQWTQSQNLHVINIGSPITTTGDLTAGSDTVTNILDTTGIVANTWAITGNLIPTSARVVEVIDATSLRIDEPPSETVVGTPLIFAKDTFDLPADFSWFLNRTMWDRTNHWELIGPMSPSEDEWERSGIVTTGPRRRWRQIGLPLACWRLWPPPTAAGDFPATLVFEYESKYWVLGVDGTRKAKISLDTDVPVIDAQALVLSTKWRLWQIKGFEYGPMQAEYLDYVSRLAARDGGSPDLSLARLSPDTYLITPASVPDGNWPG